MHNKIIVLLFVIFILLIFLYVRNSVLNSFCFTKKISEYFSNENSQIIDSCYNKLKPYVKGKKFTSDSLLNLINSIMSCLDNDESLDDSEKKEIARNMVRKLLINEGNFENSGIFNTTQTNNYIAKGYDNLTLYSNYKQNGAYDTKYRCLGYKVVSGKAEQRNKTFAELLGQSCFGSPDRQYSYIKNENDCISLVDLYGKPKTAGVWSPQCKNDSDCPNIIDTVNNYGEKKENNFKGKCIKNGYCRIPTGMKRVGFRHYSV
jgi:hypothetical protein